MRWARHVTHMGATTITNSTCKNLQEKYSITEQKQLRRQLEASTMKQVAPRNWQGSTTMYMTCPDTRTCLRDRRHHQLSLRDVSHISQYRWGLWQRNPRYPLLHSQAGSGLSPCVFCTSPGQVAGRGYLWKKAQLPLGLINEPLRRVKPYGGVDVYEYRSTCS
jgi:hypothetical protein